MGPEQFNRFDRIESRVEHPVVRLTEPHEVVGVVVGGILIQMRNRQARRNLQTADDATAIGVRGVHDAPRFGLVTT
jgi:hypothetical protein